jgi:pSer/pThr/pTyr-binding forkhead associated (FHA) protein
MNFLEIISQQSNTYELRGEVILVGRTKDNHIKLPAYQHLSRHHCFLYIVNLSWHIQDGDFDACYGDLNQWSTNGTYLNGRCLKNDYGLHLLKDQDVISFSRKEDFNVTIPRLVFHGNNQVDHDVLEFPTIEHEYD